jgi:hypothetical protein
MSSWADAEIPPPYTPTSKELEGDSYGYCYMQPSILPITEESAHDNQQ